MNWIIFGIGYLFLGCIIALLNYWLDRKQAGNKKFNFLEMMFNVFIWPLLLIEVFDSSSRLIKRSKVQGLEMRFKRVIPYLDGLIKSDEFDKSQVSMVDLAYRWFYETGRWNNVRLGGREEWEELSKNVLFSESILEQLENQERGSLLETSAALRHERQESMKRMRESGLMSNLTPESNISLSPYFEHSFNKISPALRKKAINKLKDVAARTNTNVATNAGDAALKMIRMNGPLPCIIIAPKVALVIEREPLGICFIGVIGASETIV